MASHLWLTSAGLIIFGDRPLLCIFPCARRLVNVDFPNVATKASSVMFAMETWAGFIYVAVVCINSVSQTNTLLGWL